MPLGKSEGVVKDKDVPSGAEHRCAGKTGGETLNCASANAQNQLTTCFTYDAAGNLIQNGTITYTYDAENRLIAASGDSYIYDGDGQRVEKCTEGTNSQGQPQPGTCATNATGTLYWRGLGSDPRTETNLAGTVENNYVFFNGQRVARVDSAGAVHYYFSDHLGSHGVVENATATACEQDIDYYPYGGVENDYCPNVAQNYKFTGKERDGESVLDYFDARHYASGLGRFMQPDPMGGFRGDPQGLNRYAYVRNSPLRLTDPSGMNFGLPCNGESGSCHNGLQGSWIWDTDQGTFVFVPVSVGNQNGQLQDVSANNTGVYTASFNGTNVSLTNSAATPFSAAGTTANGVWLQGTAPVSGVASDGNLGNGFSFTFYDHGKHQNFNFSWTYNGTPADAAQVLLNANFEKWNWGLHIGSDEYRLPEQPTGARNGVHFLLDREKSNPDNAVPQTHGRGHSGEYNAPGARHFFCDVVGLC